MPDGGLGLKNPAVRRLRKLIGKRSARDEAGLLVIEGPNAVVAALDAGVALEDLYVGPDLDDRSREVVERARRAGVSVTALAAGVVERIADTVTPQPLLGVALQPRSGVADLPGSGLVVVLAGVREPGNAGTIVRSAEAAGATAVVFCEGTADPWSPKVVRASAGALFHVAVVRAGRAGEVLEVLAQQGMRRLGTAATRGEAYDRLDWSVPTALVLGNESRGLPDELEASIDAWVRIPMSGRTESLNVAMAASILVFEAQRRRDPEAPA